MNHQSSITMTATTTRNFTKINLSLLLFIFMSLIDNNYYCSAEKDDSNANNNNCIDKNENCATLRMEGHCKNNAAFMRENCAKSCRFCLSIPNNYDSVAIPQDGENNVYNIGGSGESSNDDNIISNQKNTTITKKQGNDKSDEELEECVDDINKDCEKEDCLVYADRMFRDCPVTCQICDMCKVEVMKLINDANYGIPQFLGNKEEALRIVLGKMERTTPYNIDDESCRNKDPSCAFWASRDYCHTNYMKENCRPVCQIC
mmetsp:Transcript_40666/g.46221  ORF Transcript_40666/g.46221 Transcript_40666/m.46221 type:complete len:260 (+) Transcript_40666:23-802(+)